MPLVMLWPCPSQGRNKGFAEKIYKRVVLWSIESLSAFTYCQIYCCCQRKDSSTLNKRRTDFTQRKPNLSLFEIKPWRQSPAGKCSELAVILSLLLVLDAPAQFFLVMILQLFDFGKCEGPVRYMHVQESTRIAKLASKRHLDGRFEFFRSSALGG